MGMKYQKQGPSRPLPANPPVQHNKSDTLALGRMKAGFGMLRKRNMKSCWKPVVVWVRYSGIASRGLLCGLLKEELHAGFRGDAGQRGNRTA